MQRDDRTHLRPLGILLAVILLTGCAAPPAARIPAPIEVAPPRAQPGGDRPPLVMATGDIEPGDEVARVGRGVTQERCSEAGRWRSLASETSLHLELRNETPETLTFQWLDFEGRRVHYATLAPGQGYRQQTFVTHPWMAVDAQGSCRALFVPRAAGVHEVAVGAR